jgi:hypothetical protein
MVAHLHPIKFIFKLCWFADMCVPNLRPAMHLS